MAEETWRILIQDDTTAGGGAGGTGAAGAAGAAEDADTQNRTKQFHDQFSQFFSWFKPFVVVGGLFYQLYQNSQIIATVVKTMNQIMGAIVDVILLPLVPIFTAIVNAIVPLIPIIQRLSDAFFRPIVEFLTDKIAKFTNWLYSTVDWGAIERWLSNAGETVTRWMQIIYDWFTGTFLPWWSGVAWPWITKHIGYLWEWITSIDWSDIWADIKQIPEIIRWAISVFIGLNAALTTLLIAGFGAVVAASGLPWGIGAIVGAAILAGGAVAAAQIGATAGKLSYEVLGAAGLHGYQAGGYVYTGGQYRLHAGERVINEENVRYGHGGGEGVAMNNNFSIQLALTGTVDDLARELESRITDRLDNVKRRG
jgi:hypothetical protein